jgi:hypothetical protein
MVMYLCGSRSADVGSAKPGRSDLGHVNPANRAPAELEENCEKKDANKCKVSSTVDVLAGLRLLDADIDTNVQHGTGLRDTGPDERSATAEGVGHEHEEDGDADELNNAIDTGREELIL